MDTRNLLTFILGIIGEIIAIFVGLTTIINSQYKVLRILFGLILIILSIVFFYNWLYEKYKNIKLKMIENYLKISEKQSIFIVKKIVEKSKKFEKANYKLNSVKLNIEIEKVDENKSDLTYIWTIEGKRKEGSIDSKSYFKMKISGDKEIDSNNDLQLTVNFNGKEISKSEIKIIDDDENQSMKHLSITLPNKLKEDDDINLEIKYIWPKSYDNQGDMFAFVTDIFSEGKCDKFTISFESKEQILKKFQVFNLKKCSPNKEKNVVKSEQHRGYYFGEQDIDIQHLPVFLIKTMSE